MVGDTKRSFFEKIRRGRRLFLGYYCLLVLGVQYSQQCQKEAMTHTSNSDGSSAVLTEEEEEAKSRSGALQEADGEDATTTTVTFALEKVHICGHRHIQQHRRCCHGS